MFYIFKSCNFTDSSDYGSVRIFLTKIIIPQISMSIKMNDAQIIEKVPASLKSRQCNEMFTADSQKFLSGGINFIYIFFNQIQRRLSVSKRKFQLSRVKKFYIVQILIKIRRIFLKPPGRQPYPFRRKPAARPVRARAVKRKSDHNNLRFIIRGQRTHPIFAQKRPGKH